MFPRGILFKLFSRPWIFTWPWLWNKKGMIISPDESLGWNSVDMFLAYAASMDVLVTSSRKISGFSNTWVIHEWVSVACKKGVVLVLTDIDPSFKKPEFWAAMPREDARAFTNDIVILRCKNLEEMKKICDSIDTRFATATGFYRGQPVYENETISS